MPLKYNIITGVPSDGGYKSGEYGKNVELSLNIIISPGEAISVRKFWKIVVTKFHDTSVYFVLTI